MYSGSDLAFSIARSGALNTLPKAKAEDMYVFDVALIWNFTNILITNIELPKFVNTNSLH